jgi:hypothetical protein
MGQCNASVHIVTWTALRDAAWMNGDFGICHCSAALQAVLLCTPAAVVAVGT